MALQIGAALSLAVWLYLVFGRGGFWRPHDSTLPTARPSALPRVAIVIPARNEAEVIGKAVASLAAQDYSGSFHIIVVDDHSTDDTAAAARSVSAPNLTVVPAEPLEPGWTGKLWAVNQGVRQAAGISPEYLLLTDADIVHPPDNLSALIAQAAAGNYDLVSLMATLHCRTLAERALIPAFVFFFFLLYPPAWIRSRRHRTAGAAGGCMLIRREALERAGGIEQVRGELIDDCALARAVKRSGGAVWLGLSSRTASIREYRTFAEIGAMISRTAFTQLRHSWWFLIATAAGLALTYLLPVAAAFTGNALGAGAWILMTTAYVPIVRFYRQSPFWAPALPAVALFYLAATIHSAITYALGSGGMWKGRAQAARR